MNATRESTKTRRDFSNVCTGLVFQGACRYGKRCRYSHDDDGVAAMRVYLCDAMHKPCPGLMKNESCRFNSQCWYNHDPHFIAACAAAKAARRKFAAAAARPRFDACATCRSRITRTNVQKTCVHCHVKCCGECSSLERAPFECRAVVHHACRAMWRDAVFPRLWDDGYIAEFPQLRSVFIAAAT